MSLSREEIIRMARESGFNVSEYTGGKLAGKLSIFDYADVDIFIEVERALNAAYAAGAAAEREAALTKKYVPMTQDDVEFIYRLHPARDMNDEPIEFGMRPEWASTAFADLVKDVEAYVIRRAGLEVAK